MQAGKDGQRHRDGQDRCRGLRLGERNGRHRPAGQRAEPPQSALAQDEKARKGEEYAERGKQSQLVLRREGADAPGDRRAQRVPRELHLEIIEIGLVRRQRRARGGLRGARVVDVELRAGILLEQVGGAEEVATRLFDEARRMASDLGCVDLRWQVPVGQGGAPMAMPGHAGAATMIQYVFPTLRSDQHD